MQPTLYIHFGQQKTGTTSLQRFCTRNRKTLARDCGLLYPTPGTSLDEGPLHRHYALFPFDPDKWNKVKKEVDASGCKTILFSNEDLSMTGLDDESLNAIRGLFPGFAVKYIMYARRIDDACKSWYMQSVKRNHMRDMSYETYVGNRDQERSYRLYPSELLAICERQVGRENLILRIYDRDRLVNNSTIDDVFAIMGIKLPEDPDRSRPYNQGIPQEALPLITDTLRKHAVNDPTRKEIYDMIIEAFKEKPQTPLPERLHQEVEKEIERMDAFIPGYKSLYDKEKLDLSFAPSTISPQERLIIDLLYSVLFELRKKRSFYAHMAAFYENAVRPRMKAAQGLVKRLPQRFRKPPSQ